MNPDSQFARSFNPPALAFFKDAPDMPENQNFYIIQHGVRWTGMPAWKGTLSDAQTWQLVTFLSNVEKLPPVALKEFEFPVGAPLAAPVAPASAVCADDENALNWAAENSQGVRRAVLLEFDFPPGLGLTFYGAEDGPDSLPLRRDSAAPRRSSDALHGWRIRLMSDAVAEKVISTLAGVKRIPADTIKLDTNLQDLGIDSLDVFTLLFELENGVQDYHSRR